MAINRVTITGIRGIRHEISIELNGQSALIQGDNGTGKSSIERALRWALTGESAPTRESSFTSESSLIRNILVDEPRAFVELTDGGSIDATVTSTTVHASGDSYRNSCVRGNPFLRRRELLDMLENRPVDRFRYLESFLDLDTADLLIESVNAKTEALKRKRSHCVTELRVLLNRLQVLLPEDKRPPSLSLESLLQAAISMARDLNLLEPTASEESAWDLLEKANTAATSLITNNALERTRSAFSRCLEGLANCRNDWLLEIPNLESLNIARDVAVGATTEADLAELLHHAEAHFQAKTGERCPVCHQSVDWDATLEAITARMAALATFRDADSKLTAGILWWQQKLSAFNEVATTTVIAFKKESLSELECVAEPDNYRRITDALDSKDAPRLGSGILSIGSERLAAWIRRCIDSLYDLVAEALNQLPDASSRSALIALIAFAKEATAERESIRSLSSKQVALSARITILESLSESLRAARQDVARSWLTDIGDLVAEFYRAIHPEANADEVTGAPQLEVQRHGRGTLFIRGQFNNRAVEDPRWVYSVGHLDTVGLAIFLALRRFRGNEPSDAKLMILDDVVLSIDLSHARRFIKLLESRFDDHQIILLTHNELFAHWCSRLLNNIRRFPILEWSLLDGPSIGDYRSRRKVLEDVLVSGSSKEIGLALMAFLDEWLLEARYAFELSVPAQFGEKYTLSDIWGPFVKALKGIQKSLGIKIDGLDELLSGLTDLPDVRNTLAAHENEVARLYPRDVIVEISKRVIALIDLLYCQTCNSFARPTPSRASVVMLHCKKNHIQYVKEKTPTGDD